jgi:hypothetical protein
MLSLDGHQNFYMVWITGIYITVCMALFNVEFNFFDIDVCSDFFITQGRAVILRPRARQMALR